MKKILLITAVMAAYGSVAAQLKFTENFGGMTGTTLGVQNSWAPNPVVGTDVGLVVQATNTGALTYPGYTSGQNYITVARTDGRDPQRVFTSGGGAVSTAANSTFYLSFLFRMGAGTTNISDANAEYSVTLHNSANTAYPCRFFARIDGSDNVEFGISKNTSGADNNTTVQWSSNNYDRDATYLIVIRYDVVTGANNDDMWLWVNPSLAAEPATGTAVLAISNNADPGYGTQIDAIKIHQRSSTNSPIAAFDAFRVANNTTSALAWAALTPEGAPLPVKLGNIKAYEKQSGVQIDWVAYSEESLNKYQVERSADGISFSAIGEVIAQNSISEVHYGFYDPRPLAGVNFYRLKSIDLDGKSNLSSIVKVNLDKSAKGMTVYPNPVTGGNISFQSSDLLKGDYSIKLLNAAGQQVYSQRFVHNGGAINQTIQLPVNIRSGMYTMQLDNGTAKVMSKLFMVQ